MATKVFISWSGDLSRQLAEALRNWIPAVLQNVKPYFTPEDIEKGAKWDSEIATELESCNIGLICLTSENTEKPWILFEAGALSKSLDKSKVCTLLFNLEPTDLKGPLTRFQMTKFSKDDFKRLIVTINNAAGDEKLEAAVLNEVFKMWWPRLHESVSDLLSSHVDDMLPAVARSERDMLQEILGLARMSISGFAQSPEVSAAAVLNVAAMLEEMLIVIASEDYELVNRYYSRLRKPMKELYYWAGIPEAYRRFQALEDVILGRKPTVEEEAEQGRPNDR